MSTRTAGRSRIAVRYFDDRILLTEAHAWAYYRLPTVSYEFTTPAEREALATNITVALAAIRMADAEVHLRIGHRSYPAAEWATSLDATSDGGPGWHDYLDEMYRHVWAKDFWTKEVYIGVRLGQRGMRAQLSGGVIASFISAYRAGEQALGPGGRVGLGGRDRPLDGAVRAARPGADARARWRRATRLSDGHRLAVPAHADRHRRRPAAVGDAAAQVGRGRDRGAARGPGAQRPDDAAAGAPGRGVARRVPVVRAVPGRHVLPRGRAVAALRGRAAVPGRGQPADEAHRAGQGQQGRQPPAGPRQGHGRAHQGGGRRAADRASRADRGGPAAGARHHQGTAAVRLRLASADGRRADPRTVPQPRRGGDRALPGCRDRRGQLDRRPVLAAVRVAAGGPGPAELLPAAPAAVHDRGRDADRDGGPRRPGRARTPGGSGPTSARRWAGPGRWCTSTRWWRRPGTGPRRWPSRASRAAARRPWPCCSSSSSRCAARRWR